MARSEPVTPQSPPTSTRLEQYTRVVTVRHGRTPATDGADTITDSVVDPTVTPGPSLWRLLEKAAADRRTVRIAADDVPAVVAVAALATKAGVPAIATTQPRAARRAVDMVAAIQGERLPARAIRGLA